MTSYQSIQKSLFTRIQSGEWPLGALIPAEMELAVEYSCARTTVNRALQALADEGIVIRKRKGGTRVCQMPVKQASFKIDIIREQIEALGQEYNTHLKNRVLKVAPIAVCDRLKIPETTPACYIETIHMADGLPYAYEERWVNMDAVPDIIDAPLEEISANEWLIQTVPFSSGNIIFSAQNADDNIAKALQVDSGMAIFVIDRTTWMENSFITTTKIYYREGFQLSAQL